MRNSPGSEPEVIVIGAGPGPGPGARSARQRQPHTPAAEETTMNALRRHFLLITASLTTGVVLAGCGAARPAATPAADPPSPALGDLHAVSAAGGRTYLGLVTGTGAFIGIVIDGGHARAYVCDGTPHRAGALADWFAGLVSDGLVTATSSEHHLRLTARLGSRDAAGTLTLPGGQTTSFTIAVRPTARRDAGIFAGTARWRADLSGGLDRPARRPAARRRLLPHRPHQRTHDHGGRIPDWPYLTLVAQRAGKIMVNESRNGEDRAWQH